jgi:hypothetical protein
MAMAAMTRAAMGSAQDHPRVALRTRPIRSTGDRPGGPARRVRRHRREPDSRRVRDLPRPAGRRATDRQAAGVRDQPDGRLPLSRPSLRFAQEVRPRRRPGSGEHSSHRYARPPAAPERQRPCPGGRRPRRGPAGCHLEPATRQIANQLRSLLREYYPSALAAADGWKNGLCRTEVREVLRAAPTPTARPG